MHDASHGDSKGVYFWVWGALLVLTAVEVVLGYKQIFEPVRMLEILILLSVIKSALIIGYFMHLKYEKAVMRWMVTISVVACFLGLSQASVLVNIRQQSSEDARQAILALKEKIPEGEKIGRAHV